MGKDYLLVNQTEESSSPSTKSSCVMVKAHLRLVKSYYMYTKHSLCFHTGADISLHLKWRIFLSTCIVTWLQREQHVIRTLMASLLKNTYLYCKTCAMLWYLFCILSLKHVWHSWMWYQIRLVSWFELSSIHVPSFRLSVHFFSCTEKEPTWVASRELVEIIFNRTLVKYKCFIRFVFSFTFVAHFFYYTCK